MRIFQNYGLPPAYRTRLQSLSKDCSTFSDRLKTFLNDRYGASHFLKPILDNEPDAFFTNGDDAIMQSLWAQEHGMPNIKDLPSILLAQIEEHKTEVFYNVDPMRYASEFIRKLPGCVKKKVCWRAAPSEGVDFSAYDLLLCNFPSIIDSWRNKGVRAEYFTPAHDPCMDAYANQEKRPIDVVFVGGFSRYHMRRAQILEAVAALSTRYNIQFHLDCSRLTKLAESPLGLLMPLRKYRRPKTIQNVAFDPVFGLDLYKLLSSSKIVFNAAIDMSGDDRGNMRCFEAMGCGALMVSDNGNYPDGMKRNETMLTYNSPDNAIMQIETALQNYESSRRIAHNGHEMISAMYSKTNQWQQFQKLIGEI